MPDVEVPNVEVPDEPEWEVNGLQAMTSLASKPDSLQSQRVANFKESRAKTDFEILRGISLRQSLRRGGSLWSTDPQYLDVKARVALYGRSKPVKQLDVFLSHSWASKGHHKVLSLFLQSGCNIALLFWFFGLCSAVALCHANSLPMPYRYSPGSETFNEDCPLGPWVMAFGFVGTFLGLMLSPYLPGRNVRDTCFIDVACVHQADEDLTRRGIQGIAGFLAVSGELRILWSPVYLTRLWCVFELATYKKINPYGKVVLVPIFLETIVMLFYAGLFAASTAYWIVRGAGVGGYRMVVVAGAIATWPFMISTHLLRRNYKQKHQLLADFRNFDLDSVQCFSDADRDFIHSAIAELYGSKEAFTNYVRGPLLQELLGPVTQSATPERYGLLMMSPAISMIMDFTVALWKGNAPPEVVILYTLSLGLLGLCFGLRSLLKFLLLLCDRFPEPCVPRFAFFDYFQTFLIFLPFSMCLTVVAALCAAPFLTNRWELLPGVLLGLALVLLVLNWLQRRSFARWLSKTS